MPESAATTRRFDEPDELREFPLGRFELVQIGGMTVGRAEYAPGWRWSEHVGAATGQAVCEVAHLGFVVSGRNLIEMTDGRVSRSARATCSRSVRDTTRSSSARSRT